MQSSRLFRLSPIISTVALSLSACGDFGSGSTTSDLGGFGGGGGQLTVSTGGDGGGGGGTPQEFTYGMYCGVAQCVPGVADSCVSAGGSTSSSGGSDGAGGAGGEPSGGAGSTGGAGGAGPSAGGMGGGGGELGCTILDDGGQPLSTCAQIGTKQDGEVCYASSECGSGLGCVLAVDPYGDGGGPQAIGQCKPYCCGDLEAGCPDETTYCALRPMFDAVAQEADEFSPLPVPVCVATTPCTLLGGDCGVGETCTIVRESTGTTSCVPVGTGTTCQPCPCAADHICSYATGTCLKLCAPNLETCPGAGALCQGGMIASVGVCIGGDAVCE